MHGILLFVTNYKLVKLLYFYMDCLYILGYLQQPITKHTNDIICKKISIVCLAVNYFNKEIYKIAKLYLTCEDSVKFDSFLQYW